MKCLSVRQPWASLIVLGYKDIENRTWATRYRGPLLIHAARTSDDSVALRNALQQRFGLVLPPELPRGEIIGCAEIVDCVESSESAWFSGPRGFVLRNAAMCEPFALLGQLSLFDVPDHIVKTRHFSPSPLRRS